jgi:broad specificity phosphatase PhoE
MIRPQAVCPEGLHNSYYLMRHGRSLANEEGLIISHYDNGADHYGLSETGREQIRNILQEQSLLNRETLILSSDFLRTRETAQVAAEILGALPPESSPLLRERSFGDYEKTEDRHYSLVWMEDVKNDKNRAMNVESPREVQMRFRSFIEEMEKRFDKKQILIVSHGDILQIALTWLEGIPPGQHRSLKHLETGEIRPLLHHRD